MCLRSTRSSVRITPGAPSLTLPFLFTYAAFASVCAFVFCSPSSPSRKNQAWHVHTIPVSTLNHSIDGPCALPYGNCGLAIPGRVFRTSTPEFPKSFQHFFSLGRASAPRGLNFPTHRTPTSRAAHGHCRDKTFTTGFVTATRTSTSNVCTRFEDDC